ncbi:hypothetical protein [Haliangium sp.]|uniref:hypothetical protein n=1 Tax=Haliangium sp. TaxID=2663208 RepID=UPI003D11F035
MALRNLTPEAMVTVSARWLDPARDRGLIAALPIAGSLLPAVQIVHDALLTSQYLSAARATELEAVLAAIKDTDALHDRKKRGVYRFLTGLSEIDDDSERAEAYIDLRDRLLPLGLAETRRSYIDQAGDAERLPGRINPAAKALLDSIVAPEGPLTDVVESWRSAALEIVRLDERRRRLEGQSGEGVGVSRGEAYAAKLDWIRVVHSLRALLQTDKAADAETIERILAPLRHAEALADRRGGVDDEVGELPDDDGALPDDAAEPPDGDAELPDGAEPPGDGGTAALLAGAGDELPDDGDVTGVASRPALQSRPPDPGGQPGPEPRLGQPGGDSTPAR